MQCEINCFILSDCNLDSDLITKLILFCIEQGLFERLSSLEPNISSQSTTEMTQEVRVLFLWHTFYRAVSSVVKTLLWCDQSGFNPGSFKSDPVSPTARHRYDVSSELCWPGTKPRRWAALLVTRFGVIPRV